MSEMVTLWLVVLIVSIGVEVATLGLTSIWFAGGAVVAVIAAALQAPIWLQILLFFAVSLLLFFFHQTCRSQIFQQRPRKDECGKYDRQTGNRDQ